jgi:hypothetical protein
MTPERRFLITPQELIGMEYECSQCHARCSVSFERVDRIPHLCPNCPARWLSETQPSSSANSDSRAIALFLQSLQEIRGRNFGAVIRFEIAPDVRLDAAQKP